MTRVCYRRLFALVALVSLAGGAAISAQQDTPQGLASEMRALADRTAAEWRALAARVEALAGGVEPGTLQAALTGAPAGTTVYLRPGRQYVGAVRVPDGIRLTSSGPATTRAERGELVVTGSQSIVLGSNTRLDHIVTSGNATEHVSCGVIDGQTTREQQPVNVLIDHNIIDGAAGGRRGIGLHCRQGIVEDNEVINFALVGQDTQAIFGSNGEGPFVIRRNLLEAAGENIMFGGDDPRIPLLVPADILIEDNTLEKDLAWRAWPTQPTVKNLIELKNAIRVTMRRNRARYSWGSQGGYAVMLTVQSQNGRNPATAVADVLIEHNEFLHLGGGVNLIGWPQVNCATPGSETCVGQQTRGITIRNNRFLIQRATYGGQGWCLQLGREPREVTYDLTTCETDGNQILYMEGAPVLVFRMVGNLFPRSGAYGFSLNGNHRGAGIATHLPGAVITGSAFGRVLATSTTPSTGLIPSNVPDNLHMETSAMLPLVVDGYGTGVLEPYGRRVQ